MHLNQVQCGAWYLTPVTDTVYSRPAPGVAWAAAISGVALGALGSAWWAAAPGEPTQCQMEGGDCVSKGQAEGYAAAFWGLGAVALGVGIFELLQPPSIVWRRSRSEGVPADPPLANCPNPSPIVDVPVKMDYAGAGRTNGAGDVYLTVDADSIGYDSRATIYAWDGYGRVHPAGIVSLDGFRHNNPGAFNGGAQAQIAPSDGSSIESQVTQWLKANPDQCEWLVKLGYGLARQFAGGDLESWKKGDIWHQIGSVIVETGISMTEQETVKHFCGGVAP